MTPFVRRLMVAAATFAVASGATVTAGADVLDSPVSLGKPTSASAATAGHDPANVVDGDRTNARQWSAPLASNGSAWWQVDLQGTFQIRSTNVRTYVDGQRHATYQVRGSLNGIDWYPIGLKNRPTVATDAGDTFGSEIAARYVRVDLYAESGDAQLTEVSVHGTPVQVPDREPVAFDCETSHPLRVAGQTQMLDCVLENRLDRTVSVTDLSATTAGLTAPLAPRISKPIDEIGLRAKEKRQVRVRLLSAGESLERGAHAVYVRSSVNGVTRLMSPTFFRIGERGDLTTYRVNRSSYKDFPVYAMDGGLSTEWGVQKAAEGLTGGLSHSWKTRCDGCGPRPVWGTPDFVRDSVRYTVDFYDSAIGRETPIDNVVVGLFSDGNLERSLKAAWLPAHFLTNTNSIQEITGIIDQANADGYSTTATTGGDGSVCQCATSWINLLRMPPEYLEFLRRHKVKSVYFTGGNGTPTMPAYQVIRRPGGSATQSEGTIELVPYLDQLDKFTTDYLDWDKSASHAIADWEVSYAASAVPGMAANAKAAGFTATLVTGDTHLQMFDIGTAATLSFMRRNASAFTDKGRRPAVRGIVLNPYHMGHPVYENWLGYVPLYYVTFGDTTEHIVDSRMLGGVARYVEHYFGKTDLTKLPVLFDTARNFGSGYTVPTMIPYLKERGFGNVWTLPYETDEVWDPGDGAQSAVEAVAERLTKETTAKAVREWNRRLSPITQGDVRELGRVVPGVSVIEY
ncbi:discoidin domain-containing protein [Actinopolymorpha alba]|uniref:discoidin domain-containing protein n=1 Tax=Actinopolymorpha alba TaxID=533267 RepID=UPI00039AD1D9|nr:discoidin domain-containing protein [Actinopolymorpha alba]